MKAVPTIKKHDYADDEDDESYTQFSTYEGLMQF